MITTALTQMFKLRHPIVLGAMAGVSGGRLVPLNRIHHDFSRKARSGAFMGRV